MTRETIYIWAGRSLSPYSFRISSQAEALSKFGRVGAKSHAELLMETFIETQVDNPFAESGYCPKKLVSTYVWVTK